MTCSSPQAFTLVEMLVAVAVSAILLGLVLSITNQVSATVGTVTGKMDAFQSGQAGFDIMTQKLADATLNTYYDYATSSGIPTAYIRKSDLHFYIAQNTNVAGSPANPNSGHSIYFQAPEGYSNTSTTYANTPGLLNACGYFVEFGPDNTYRPTLFSSSSAKNRYRLMQAIQSTENNGIYSDKEGTTAETAPVWINSLNSLALPIAENIIALIIQNPSVYTLTSGSSSPVSPDYQYNSRQGIPPPVSGTNTALQSEQMPPVLEITMVAIDGPSAIRLDDGSGNPPAIIENALKNKFALAANYSADLSALESALAANHIHYQILSTSVTLRESKWSSGQ